MSKMGNNVVGANEDGTLIFNEQESCYEEADMLLTELAPNKDISDKEFKTVVAVFNKHFKTDIFGN